MKNDKLDDYYHTDIDYLDLSDAVSMHECTGLIPAGDAGSKNYQTIYSFGTPLKCSRDKHKKGNVEK